MIKYYLNGTNVDVQMLKDHETVKSRCSLSLCKVVELLVVSK